MYFKVGENRPYLLEKTVYYGKILKVDEDDIFIGDD